jgi:hypothetical protein
MENGGFAGMLMALMAMQGCTRSDSYGDDGQPGGDGENADIGNWEASGAPHT